MVWIPYATYRGCALHYSDTDPRRFWSPCVADPSYSDAALRADIDLTLGPEPEPDPEPPQDYIAETYRDVDIWWKVEAQLYWAQVAMGYVAMWPTLEEMRTSIDEILDYLYPPEDPEEGLFAQVVAALKTWIMENIQPWVEAWGRVVNNWITNVVEEITNVYNYLTEQITNVYNYLTENITYVYNTFREYITNVYNYTTENITNVYNTLNEYVTNIIGVSEEILNQRIIGVTRWVLDLFALLDPHAFLEDPLAFIRTAFNTFINPWAEGMVRAFWEGFEEGLEE